MIPNCFPCAKGRPTKSTGNFVKFAYRGSEVGRWGQARHSEFRGGPSWFGAPGFQPAHPNRHTQLSSDQNLFLLFWKVILPGFILQQPFNAPAVSSSFPRYSYRCFFEGSTFAWGCNAKPKGKPSWRSPVLTQSDMFAQCAANACTSNTHTETCSDAIGRPASCWKSSGNSASPCSPTAHAWR